MCDQEAQSDAFVAEASNVYCAVVVGDERLRQPGIV